jgi:hypothetical protein
MAAMDGECTGGFLGVSFPSKIYPLELASVVSKKKSLLGPDAQS